MQTLIFQCKLCQTFTLSEKCSICSSNTSNPLPSRFSPEDRYGKYRRMLRENK